jgi:aminoglycoside phosphotransferase (APT) family kinase protein
MLDRMEPLTSANPSDTTLAWVAAAAGAGARVVGCGRLLGGITSSVHGVTVLGPGGSTHELVLKQWADEDLDSAGEMVEREAILLRCLAGSGLPAPSLIAESGGEDTDGQPSLLMTRLAGEVNLTPSDPSGWIAQMAATLAQIHSLRIDAPFSEPEHVSVPEAPSWSPRGDLWAEARRLLALAPPEGETFIHGDFQHFNLLWSGQELTGVIDWTWAGLGHPDRDAGHCRLNLAVLFSAAWAEEFAARYEREAGRRIEPWWDVYALSRYSRNWREFIPVQAGGRAPVDLAGMDERVSQLLADALSR